MQLNEKITDSKLSRRTVVKAGAWAVPVVAAAVAVPMAAASAASARISAGSAGSIVVDSPTTASGTLNGQIQITGVKNGPWATGNLVGSYEGTGQWKTFEVVQADGSPFVQESVIEYSGIAWLVTFVDSDANGTWKVSFSAPSQNVSSDTILFLPPAIFSGTFTAGSLTTRNPVSGTVGVAAGNINDGVAVGASATYPVA